MMVQKNTCPIGVFDSGLGGLTVARSIATALPQHRFATTSDNLAEFAAAGSFIFGQPLKSIEHVSLEELV